MRRRTHAPRESERPAAVEAHYYRRIAPAHDPEERLAATAIPDTAALTDASIHRPDERFFDPRLIGANAYTIGRDIVLAPHVDLGSDAGRATLSHELYHAGRDRDDGVVRRQVNLDEQSIGATYAEGLSVEQLEEDLAYLAQRKRDTSPGTVEHEVASSNLAIVAAEAARRGHDSPALQRDAVATSLAETFAMIRVLADAITKIAKNPDGISRHPATEGFVAGAVDQLSRLLDMLESAHGLLSSSGAADPETAIPLLVLAREHAFAASRGAELLRRHHALLQLSDMAVQYVPRIGAEYTLRALLDASQVVDTALADLQINPGSPDSLARVSAAITSSEASFLSYSAQVKSLSPEYSLETSLKGLEAEVAAPPGRTDPRPHDDHATRIPDVTSVGTSLDETGEILRGLVGMLGELARNDLGLARHPATEALIDDAAGSLDRATSLTLGAIATLDRAQAADPASAIALYQQAATQASAARAAVDLVRSHILILRLADTAVYHNVRVDPEFMIRSLHPLGVRVAGVLSQLEGPGADASIAEDSIRGLTEEFHSFGKTMKDLDRQSRKMEAAVIAVLALIDIATAGFAMRAMMRPPGGTSLKLPPGAVQLPSQTTSPLPAAPKYLTTPPVITPPSRPPLFAPRVPWQATRPKGTLQRYDVFPRTDINWDMVRTHGDQRGRGLTNRDAAARYGLPPQLDADGNFATLHHLGQDARGPLVEANTKYHGVQSPYQDTLHSQYGRSKPHPTNQPDRKKFDVDDREYWKWRAANP